MTKRNYKSEFIQKAIAIHGHRYSYSQVVYKNNRTKTTIECKEHGLFGQRPSDHLKGHGCDKCAKKLQGKRQVYTSEKFISKATARHGDKYLYDLVEYVNSKHKVEIICRQHGSFLQLPAAHVFGQGCPICAGNIKSNTKEFISKARQIHGDLYDYSQTRYASDNEKVLIICNLHGDFEQTAGSHLAARGCPKCAAISNGWSRSVFIRRCKENNNNKGLLYVIRCYGNNEVFYKVGITSMGIKARFKANKIPYDYQKIFTVEGDGASIYNLESSLHKLLATEQYSPAINFDGYTECFGRITDEVVRKLKAMSAHEYDTDLDYCTS